MVNPVNFEGWRLVGGDAIKPRALTPNAKKPGDQDLSDKYDYKFVNRSITGRDTDTIDPEATAKNHSTWENIKAGIHHIPQDLTKQAVNLYEAGRPLVTGLFSAPLYLVKNLHNFTAPRGDITGTYKLAKLMREGKTPEEKEKARKALLTNPILTAIVDTAKDFSQTIQHPAESFEKSPSNTALNLTLLGGLTKGGLEVGFKTLAKNTAAGAATKAAAVTAARKLAATRAGKVATKVAANPYVIKAAKGAKFSGHVFINPAILPMKALSKGFDLGGKVIKNFAPAAKGIYGFAKGAHLGGNPIAELLAENVTPAGLDAVESGENIVHHANDTLNQIIADANRSSPEMRAADQAERSAIVSGMTDTKPANPKMFPGRNGKNLISQESMNNTLGKSISSVAPVQMDEGTHQAVTHSEYGDALLGNTNKNLGLNLYNEKGTSRPDAAAHNEATKPIQIYEGQQQGPMNPFAGIEKIPEDYDIPQKEEDLKNAKDFEAQAAEAHKSAKERLAQAKKAVKEANSVKAPKAPEGYVASVTAAKKMDMAIAAAKKALQDLRKSDPSSRLAAAREAVAGLKRSTKTAERKAVRSELNVAELENNRYQNKLKRLEETIQEKTSRRKSMQEQIDAMQKQNAKAEAARKKIEKAKAVAAKNLKRAEEDAAETKEDVDNSISDRKNIEQSIKEAKKQLKEENDKAKAYQKAARRPNPDARVKLVRPTLTGEQMAALYHEAGKLPDLLAKNASPATRRNAERVANTIRQNILNNSPELAGSLKNYQRAKFFNARLTVIRNIRNNLMDASGNITNRGMNQLRKAWASSSNASEALMNYIKDNMPMESRKFVKSPADLKHMFNEKELKKMLDAMRRNEEYVRRRSILSKFKKKPGQESKLDNLSGLKLAPGSLPGLLSRKFNIAKYTYKNVVNMANKHQREKFIAALSDPEKMRELAQNAKALQQGQTIAPDMFKPEDVEELKGRVQNSVNRAKKAYEKGGDSEAAKKVKSIIDSMWKKTKSGYKGYAKIIEHPYYPVIGRLQARKSEKTREAQSGTMLAPGKPNAYMTTDYDF